LYFQLEKQHVKARITFKSSISSVMFFRFQNTSVAY